MSDGRRRAILVASSQFPAENSLGELRCPENDVDGLSDLLGAKEFGAFDEITTIKNERSHEALIKINRALREAHTDDLTLIYYSGHGKTDRHHELYLTTIDTQLKLLESTSIPFERIYSFIKNSDCKRIAMILDCCYSGAAATSIVKGSVDEKLESVSKSSGVYVLTASSAFQTAQEREDDHNSLLTKHILHGIRQGEADLNWDGKVSMDDLYHYVVRNVLDEGKQEPMRWDISVRGGEMMIAWAGKARTAKLKQIEDLLIEMRTDLPARVRMKAFQIILDAQSQAGTPSPYLKLLENLFERRLHKGDFLDEWDLLDVAERQQQPSQPPESKSQSVQVVEQAQQKESALKIKEHSQSDIGINIEVWRLNTFTENLNGVELEMILVPAGTFKMGSPWEYACRAGTTGDYAGELDAMGWYGKNSGSKTKSVGQKQANAFGLYDMHGNVWEWCEDVWHKNYDGAPTDGSAWLSDGDSTWRVLRGGSWVNYGWNGRSAYRNWNHAGVRADNRGFRVVISARTT